MISSTSKVAVRRTTHSEVPLKQIILPRGNTHVSLAPVVRRLDKFIHQINHYAVDKTVWTKQTTLQCACICWIVICPVDRLKHPGPDVLFPYPKMCLMSDIPCMCINYLSWNYATFILKTTSALYRLRGYGICLYILPTTIDKNCRSTSYIN